MTIERVGPPLTGDERETLRAFLDFHRATLAMKCEGLVEHARRIEREAATLDVTGYNVRWGEDVSLRPVMLHLIHEYARRNGHADLIREGIDGVVGA